MGVSQRKIASEFQISQKYKCEILKESFYIKCCKKLKRGLMTQKQKKSLRPKCKQLVEKYRDYKFIIDNES